MLKRVLAIICVTIIFSIFSIDARAEVGYDFISSYYGDLVGETYFTELLGCKVAESIANTRMPVTRIRAKLEVQYTYGGGLLGMESSGWVSNSTYAGAEYDTYHVPNAKNNNLCDGFSNTSLTAYGTADAITSMAYVVYTSERY